MRESASDGFGASSEWRSENSDSWILPQSCATWGHRRVIAWKRFRATEKDSTAFASTISGASVSCGATAMRMMLKL